jgi:hypothetical protein
MILTTPALVCRAMTVSRRCWAFLWLRGENLADAIGFLLHLLL